jgi:hypothetical protein
MSIVELQAATPSPAVAVTWSRVAENLWVASNQREFVGTVEALGARFRASDHRGIVIADVRDLDTAMGRVLHPDGRGYDRRYRTQSAVGDLRLARATAIVAGAVCVGSVILLMTGLGS